MAAPSSKPCDPCKYDDVIQDAIKWCTVCNEALCKECSRAHQKYKALRDHIQISIEDHIELKGLQIDLDCSLHCKRLEYYCRPHDQPICRACIAGEHKTCADTVPIEDFVKGVKESAAFVDLEEIVQITFDNLQSYANIEQSAILDIDNQSKSVKASVRKIRVDFNKHLDELEKRFFDELETKVSECKSKYRDVSKACKVLDDDVRKAQRRFIKVKEVAPDLHAFLVSKNMNKELLKNSKAVQEVLKSVKKCTILTSVNPALSSLLTEMKSLGEINVHEVPANLKIVESKSVHAQKQKLPATKIFHAIKLDLLCSIEIEKKASKSARFTGCTMTKKKIYIADCFVSQTLFECSPDGKFLQEVGTTAPPFDVAGMSNDLIAVTYGTKQYLEIIDVGNRTVEKKVILRRNCWGIASQNQKLYVVVFSEGLVEIDYTGEVLRTIKISTMCTQYVTVTKDRIAYTSGIANEIRCCDFSGKEIWTLHDPALMSISGVTTDSDQNVYVVDNVGNKLVLIQHDGKVFRTLLTSDDGLDNPVAVCYDPAKSLLCLGYTERDVAVYYVS